MARPAQRCALVLAHVSCSLCGSASGCAPHCAAGRDTSVPLLCLAPSHVTLVLPRSVGTSAHVMTVQVCCRAKHSYLVTHVTSYHTACLVTSRAASGDPAAACCSNIPELQNPLINQNPLGLSSQDFGVRFASIAHRCAF